MQAIETARPTRGTVAACDALGVAGATPPRALDPGERQAVLDMLHRERFLDQAPA